MAHFEDGCVNFSKFESAAKDETMVCAVFPFHEVTGELKNNGHEKGRKKEKMPQDGFLMIFLPSRLFEYMNRPIRAST